MWDARLSAGRPIPAELNNGRIFILSGGGGSYPQPLNIHPHIRCNRVKNASPPKARKPSFILARLIAIGARWSNEWTRSRSDSARRGAGNGQLHSGQRFSSRHALSVGHWDICGLPQLALAAFCQPFGFSTSNVTSVTIQHLPTTQPMNGLGKTTVCGPAFGGRNTVAYICRSNLPARNAVPLSFSLLAARIYSSPRLLTLSKVRLPDRRHVGTGRRDRGAIGRPIVHEPPPLVE